MLLLLLLLFAVVCFFFRSLLSLSSKHLFSFHFFQIFSHFFVSFFFKRKSQKANERNGENKVKEKEIERVKKDRARSFNGSFQLSPCFTVGMCLCVFLDSEQ